MNANDGSGDRLWPDGPGPTPPDAAGAPVRPALHEDRPAAESPAARLAAGFAAHVVAWSRERGADDAAQAVAGSAAAALSLATSEGHVCLALPELARRAAPGVDAAALRAALLASGTVGTPGQPGALPMVLDDDGRLYLHRYFDFERRLAVRLARAAAPAEAEASGLDAATRRQLDALFPADAAAPDGEVDWQKAAVALALHGRLTVVSGGPGTGKTTTVVNLLACLVARAPECRIALAAPTGKAAARMTEAIRQRAAHLPEALRERLPTGASTVHRLLGATPAPGRFVHHAGHPLPIDVLVVDEASMLDLALATRLLEAVPASARIILLGDKDQLSAVESGAVFAELGADPGLSDAGRRALADACGLAPERLRPPVPSRESPLKDTVVWLTRNFRFAAGSGIGRLATDINGARAAAAVAWLRTGADPSVRWLEEGGSQPGDEALRRLQAGHDAFLQAVLRDPLDEAGIADAFGRFGAVCAVREGPRGLLALDALMTRHARERLAPLAGASEADPRSPWFVGRPVMVLRNDPVLRLFNGDLGIALPDAAGRLGVVFPDPAGGFRRVAPVRLPEHRTAFAMTVHKAQGSEFDEVLVMLPQHHGPVLTRELLYTAVTRARHRVTLACSADVLVAAIESPTRRDAGLLARLSDAMAPAAPG